MPLQINWALLIIKQCRVVLRKIIQLSSLPILTIKTLSASTRLYSAAAAASWMTDLNRPDAQHGRVRVAQGGIVWGRLLSLLSGQARTRIRLELWGRTTMITCRRSLGSWLWPMTTVTSLLVMKSRKIGSERLSIFGTAGSKSNGWQTVRCPATAPATWGDMTCASTSERTGKCSEFGLWQWRRF